MTNRLKIVEAIGDTDLIALQKRSSGEFQGLPLETLEARLEAAIDASLSLKFVPNGTTIGVTPLDETFLDVDLSGDGLENNTIVNAYNPPGVIDSDPEFRDFTCTQDQFAYDKGVKPEFYHDQAGSQFDTYYPDIKRFNQLYQAIREYTAGPFTNNGVVKVRILNGLHRIWGAGALTGLNGGTSIQGESVFYTTATSASFGPSSRGATWSRATITVDVALSPDVVVGMMYQTGEIISDATDHTASSEAAIVTDDLALLNTGFAITEIAIDRLSFSFDVPHVGTSTTQLVGGTIRTTGAGKTGFPAGRLTFALTQIAFTGGFDGRQDEAWLRPQYGSLIEYADIGFVETTDPTITRSNGYAPDRKGVFAANVGDVLLRQNVGIAGAEGHVLRIAKLIRLSANLARFGGAGLSTRAGRSAYAQIVSFADFTRCSFGNSLTYSLLASGLVFISAQNCVAVGGAFGVQAITGSQINFQNSLIYGAGTGIFVGSNSTVTVDAGTVIENCGFTWQIRDTSNIVKLAEPIIIGSGAIIDRREKDPVFEDNLIIDKTNGELIMKHGLAVFKIQNLIGQPHFVTDNRARDVHFGHTDAGGEDISLFVMDMFTKQLKIEGEAVIGPRGAAIADPTADAASNNAAILAILARMRAAEMAIET